MKLTPKDRLLLGKTFTFESDLSPAECAARIEQISTHAIANERWRGEVEPSQSTEWLYLFEVNTGEFSARPAVIDGVIKQSVSGKGCVVSGVTRYAEKYHSTVILDQFRVVMLFVTGGILLGSSAGTIQIGSFNTYWLNLLGVVGMAWGLVVYLMSDDQHLKAKLELLGLQLKSQQPQPTHDPLQLRWLDRILFARVFTFRSDLSPAACAERIRELTSQAEDEGIWIGAAIPSVDVGENSYWFDLKLRRQAASHDGITSNAQMRGSIEPGDALGGSIIVGVLRSNPSLWIQIGVLGVVVLLLLLSLTFEESGASCLICGLLYGLLFMGVVTWTAWSDRKRTLKRLERSLQTSYRAQKKKALSA